MGEWPIITINDRPIPVLPSIPCVKRTSKNTTFFGGFQLNKSVAIRPKPMASWWKPQPVSLRVQVVGFSCAVSMYWMFAKESLMNLLLWIIVIIVFVVIVIVIMRRIEFPLNCYTYSSASQKPGYVQPQMRFKKRPGDLWNGNSRIRLIGGTYKVVPPQL